MKPFFPMRNKAQFQELYLEKKKGIVSTIGILDSMHESFRATGFYAICKNIFCDPSPI